MSPSSFAPLVALALALTLAGCGNPAEHSARPAPSHSERAALARPPGPVSVPLHLAVPADGAVVPWSFPALELRWEDGFRANAFQVRVRAGQGEALVDAFTTERRLALSPSELARIRSAAGEGGAFEVELVAASLLPGGRVLRGPTTVVSHARFSGPGEHPTGSITYAAQLRPRGAPPGPSDRSHRLLHPLRVSMSGQEEPLLWGIFDERIVAGYQAPSEKRQSYEDLGIPEWASRPPESITSRSLDYSSVDNTSSRPVWRDLYPRPQGPCMGCHVSSSSDGTFVSMMAAFDDRRPGAGGDTLQTLFVVRAEDREIVVQKRYGFFARFHPNVPYLLTYALWANEFKDGLMASIYQSDLHVLDLRDGRDTLVPGASEPDRCEMIPEWSPDGQWMVFSRAPVGEPCDGERGSLEIARIPWNEGRGGPATVLVEVPPGGGANMQPRYSPDGRWIVFFRTDRGFYSSGSADLWIVPAQGGPARRLGVSTDAMESYHAFSPDGRWLAFQSNVERVDKVKGYVARFFEDGHVAPAVPLPGAGSSDVAISSLDWGK